MPPKAGTGSQDLQRTLLVFLTRLKALNASNRPASAKEALRAAAALDAAANVDTHAWKDACGSPSGLGLTQSLELAEDACAALLEACNCSQLEHHLQRICIRAALKAILALLPMHIGPGDQQSLRLMCSMTMTQPVPSIWLLLTQPCIDKFQYRHLASNPAVAKCVVQDMLMYIAVLDRFHMLFSECTSDSLARKQASPGNEIPAELLTIVLSQAVWRKRLDVSSSLRASFVDLAHAVTSLAVHMIGAKPAKFLYKKEEDWEADRAVATSLNPSELLSSIPGAWVSPLNLIRRALDMAIPHNSRQWDSYKGAALEKMIDTLWLAVTGVRGALQPESKQAGQQGRQLKQELTPTYMRMLIHALTVAYMRCFEDLLLREMRNIIAPTTVCFADLLEMCFHCSGVLSALWAKPSRASKQGRKDTGGSTRPSSGQRSGSESTETLSAPGGAVASGSAPGAAAADGRRGCDGSTSAVIVASSSCDAGMQQQQFSQSPQHDQQEEREAHQEDWLRACDAAAWSLYQVVHLMALPPPHGNGLFRTSLSKSSDPDERLTSLYWVPFQAVQVAWSVGKLLSPEEVIGSAPGSTAFAASAAATALVQSARLVNRKRHEKSEEPALEVASYCRKVLKYLLPAVQALQKQYTSRQPSQVEGQPTEAASAVSSDPPSSATTSSSGEGSDISSSNASATPTRYTSSNLRTTLLLLFAALSFPHALGGFSINDDASLNVEEWGPHLVTLGFEALSLLCDLVEDEEWLSAAKQHQPLLLLQATTAGLQAVSDFVTTMVPDIKDVHNRTVLRSHILQYLAVPGRDGRPRAPLVSHCQILLEHQQALRHDPQVVGDTSPMVRWSPHDRCYTQNLKRIVGRTLRNVNGLFEFAFSMMLSYMAEARLHAEEQLLSASTGSWSEEEEDKVAGGTYDEEELLKDTQAGQVHSWSAGGKKVSALDLDWPLKPSEARLLVAFVLHMRPQWWKPGTELRDVADTEDLSMEWAGLQLEMLLQAMVTLKMSGAVLGLEPGYRGQRCSPTSLQLERLQQLLGGGGYQGDLLFQDPSSLSTPLSLTTAAGTATTQASTAPAPADISPSPAAAATPAANLHGCPPSALPDQTSSCSTLGQSRSPQDNVLLHHATIFLRTRLKLRRTIVYAFGSRIPHLRDIYVCKSPGEEFDFLEAELPWDADTVAGDADTEEHKRYMVWLFDQLMALLQDMVVSMQIWKQPGAGR